MRRWARLRPDAARPALAARAERIDPSVGTTAFIEEDRHGKVFLDSTRGRRSHRHRGVQPAHPPRRPVSFPLRWNDIDDVTPADFTLRSVPNLLGGTDPWTTEMPAPQALPADLVAEGHTIPIAREAMHEGIGGLGRGAPPTRVCRPHAVRWRGRHAISVS
ncbi:non-homologous end-joining DNA ligase LigD [Nocardia rhizosphaerihabitans]|uniref:DNA ligase D polymerase domain-containing protein n=1 Tax=Nocardia rhizosphaerihabitans TaxID=1691570 RepID=A0ABQ2KB57_9NOCA|nr:hypothetical protein GCM10011610_24490 [Nocardia rhizosphaerihabitans]